MTSTLKARAAAAAVGAVALAGLGLVHAAPASAEVLDATGGSLQWGIKGSLLSYHLRHIGTTQSATPEDGATAGSATRGTAPETYPTFWEFPFQSGSYDSATNRYLAQYGGSVVIKDSNSSPAGSPTTTASPFKYLKISNPKVVIDVAGGTKQLSVNLAQSENDGAGEVVDFATFPQLTTAKAPSNGTIAYESLDTAFAQAGADQFKGDESTGFSSFYNPGDALDAVTTTLTGLGSADAPQGGQPAESGAAEPPPAALVPARSGEKLEDGALVAGTFGDDDESSGGSPLLLALAVVAGAGTAIAVIRILGSGALPRGLRTGSARPR